MHCKRVIRKIEKRNLGFTSSTDSIEISLHLRFCSNCRSYERFSSQIDQLLLSMYAEERTEQFTDQEKAKIIEVLNSHVSN